MATDQGSVELLAKCFETDYANAREVTLRAFGMRSLWARIKETTAGWIEKWL